MKRKNLQLKMQSPRFTTLEKESTTSLSRLDLLSNPSDKRRLPSQLDFVRSAPETLPIVGDLIVRNMDWPQADEFAERMKKMLPPQLQDENEQGQAQMAQQSQMLMPQNQQLIASRQ